MRQVSHRFPAERAPGWDGELPAFSLDESEVLAQIADVAVRVANAEGAIAWRAGATEQPVAVGLPPAEAVALERAARGAAPARPFPLGRERLGVRIDLASSGRHSAALAVAAASTDEAWARQALDALALIARSAGQAVANAVAYRELQELADRDALTGVHNRRFFDDALAREVKRARRYGRELTLLLLDVDDFKRVNTERGHLAGDAVLVHVADRIRGTVRAADSLCRFGGEEFAIILPESTADDGEALFRRLSEALADSRRGGGALSASAGITSLAGDDTPVSFVERADLALRRAKSEGKSRAVVI